MLHDQAPRAGRQVDLLAIAEGFAVSAGGITGLRGLDEGQKVNYEIVKDKRTGKSAADNLTMAG